MINTDILKVEDVIRAYELAGYTLKENYTSISIRQLKFKRDNVYVDFIWKSDKWDFPLKQGHIDVHVIGKASYSSNTKWAEMEGHKLPKELLYEASVTIDSEEKLILYLNNALTEKALEELE